MAAASSNAGAHHADQALPPAAGRLLGGGRSDSADVVASHPGAGSCGVVSAARTTYPTTAAEVAKAIHGAGFLPACRRHGHSLAEGRDLT